MNRSTSQGGERPSRQLSRTAREEREEQQAPVRNRNTRQGGERGAAGTCQEQEHHHGKRYRSQSGTGIQTRHVMSRRLSGTRKLTWKEKVY